MKKGTPKKTAADRHIRLLLVDDHPIVLQGIRATIEAESDLKICATANSLGSALKAFRDAKPSMAIVDLSLDGRSGLELIQQIRQYDAQFPVLVMTIHDDVSYAERALKAGARGYLVKTDPSETLIEGIRRVWKGDVFLSESIAARMLNRICVTGARPADESPVHKLSNRELEVLELIGRGLPTRRIASTLHISTHTVETYRVRLKDKLGFPSGVELSNFAVQWVLSPASFATDKASRRPSL